MKRLAALVFSLLFFSAPCAAYDTTAANGVVNAKKINNVLHVGAGTKWTGDIGAQINAAYAALPSNGGTIYVDPPASGSTYDFSTPIVLSTAGKIVRIVGVSPAGVDHTEGVSLNYTPTSGAAISLDYATNISSSSSGFTNINLVNNSCKTKGGCGGTATGIDVGQTNYGDAGATYLNVSIHGFDTAYQNHHGPNSVDQNWINPTFRYNKTALKIAGGLTEKFFGGTMVSNDRVVVSSTSDGASELYFFGTNIFNNTGASGPVFDYTATSTVSNLELHGVHLENCGVGGNCTTHFIGGSFNAGIFGGVMENDDTGCTCDWMINPTANNTQTTLVGTRLSSNTAIFTQFLLTNNLTRGSINPMVVSATQFPTIIGGTNAANTSYCATYPSTVTPVCYMAMGASLHQPIVLPTYGVASLPTCNTASKNSMAVASNLLSPTFNATATAGGTVVLPVFCNGTNWVTP